MPRHSERTFLCGSACVQPDWVLNPDPRVKPSRSNNPGVPGANFVEDDKDKIGYAIGDFEEGVRNLSANHENFVNYLREVRLIKSLPAESST